MTDDKVLHPKPGLPGSWSESPGGDMVRGTDRHELGGWAGSGQAGRYVYCGNCSKEPLAYETAVIMKVKVVGWPMTIHGEAVHVDVLECPKCGTQVIR